MRLTDFFLVLPTFVLAIILAPVILDIIGVEAEIFGLRATLLVIVVVIGITSWATTARIIRSQTLSMRERMFVDRARVIGSGQGHIMRRHIFPNVVNLIVANAVLTFAAAVFTETSLSFIGLGDPFAPSWGQILDSAQSAGAPGLGAWWYIAPPAVCVVLVVLAFTLVGNALDDILNPKSADPPMTDPRRRAASMAERLSGTRTARATTSRTARGASGRAPRRTPRRRGAAATPRRRRPTEPSAGRIRGRRQWPLPKQADPGRAAARRRGPADALQARVGLGQGGRRRELPAQRRRGAGARRRVGLRQDHDRAVAGPAPARERPDPQGQQHRAVRDRPRAQDRGRSCGAIAGARSASSSRAR